MFQSSLKDKEKVQKDIEVFNARKKRLIDFYSSYGIDDLDFESFSSDAFVLLSEFGINEKDVQNIRDFYSVIGKKNINKVLDTNTREVIVNRLISFIHDIYSLYCRKSSTSRIDNKKLIDRLNDLLSRSSLEKRYPFLEVDNKFSYIYEHYDDITTRAISNYGGYNAFMRRIGYYSSFYNSLGNIVSLLNKSSEINKGLSRYLKSLSTDELLSVYEGIVSSSLYGYLDIYDCGSNPVYNMHDYSNLGQLSFPSYYISFLEQESLYRKYYSPSASYNDEEVTNYDLEYRFINGYMESVERYIKLAKEKEILSLLEQHMMSDKSEDILFYVIRPYVLDDRPIESLNEKIKALKSNDSDIVNKMVRKLTREVRVPKNQNDDEQVFKNPFDYQRFDRKIVDYQSICEYLQELYKGSFNYDIKYHYYDGKNYLGSFNHEPLKSFEFLIEYINSDLKKRIDFYLKYKDYIRFSDEFMSHFGNVIVMLEEGNYDLTSIVRMLTSVETSNASSYVPLFDFASYFDSEVMPVIYCLNLMLPKNSNDYFNFLTLFSKRDYTLINDGNGYDFKNRHIMYYPHDYFTSVLGDIEECLKSNNVNLDVSVKLFENEVTFDEMVKMAYEDILFPSYFLDEDGVPESLRNFIVSNKLMFTKRLENMQ